ncbi:MAG: hypothetical protein ACVCEJ_00570 [Candidatus Izemoplasmataceae bacterium]
MLRLIRSELKQTKNWILLPILFAFFLGLYIFLDFEGNTNYRIMTENFGIGIVSIHIVINIIIAVLSSIMVTFAIVNQRLTKIDPKGSNAIPFLTFIFGLLTFGCTGCVVAFFTSVGIAFTPIILPAGNMLWKVIALLFVIAGFVYVMYTIEHTKCKVKLKEVAND